MRISMRRIIRAGVRMQDTDERMRDSGSAMDGRADRRRVAGGVRRGVGAAAKTARETARGGRVNRPPFRLRRETQEAEGLVNFERRPPRTLELGAEPFCATCAMTMGSTVAMAACAT